MSEDLLSLKFLVVSADPPVRSLWRSAAGLASLPIEFVDADATTAAPALTRGGIDVLIIDHEIGASVRDAVVKAARSLRPGPLIVVSAPEPAARLDSVDGVVANPGTVDEARGLIERCIRCRMPTRILVVDDSSTMRSIVRKVLSASRYALEVSEASEGLTALAEIHRGGIDLVILDYNMPGLNGLETLYEIKRKIPDVAVVMMTTTVDASIAERALASGAAGFLKKPFYPVDIDAVLDRYFGLSPAPTGAATPRCG